MITDMKSETQTRRNLINLNEILLRTNKKHWLSDLLLYRSAHTYTIIALISLRTNVFFFNLPLFKWKYFITKILVIQKVVYWWNIKWDLVAFWTFISLIKKRVKRIEIRHINYHLAFYLHNWRNQDFRKIFALIQ